MAAARKFGAVVGASPYGVVQSLRRPRRAQIMGSFNWVYSMDRRKRPRSSTAAPELAALAQKLVHVPDKLLIVQMHLQPLADSNPGAMPRDPYAISEACSILHSAIADVVEVARALRAISTLQEKGERRRTAEVRPPGA
jgi:hypothetical protein